MERGGDGADGLSSAEECLGDMSRFAEEEPAWAHRRKDPKGGVEMCIMKLWEFCLLSFKSVWSFSGLMVC